MPTYAYVCNECGATYEQFYHNPNQAPHGVYCGRPVVTHNKADGCCPGMMERQIGPGGGFLFKGSGFHTTDYRSDSYMKGAGQ